MNPSGLNFNDIAREMHEYYRTAYPQAGYPEFDRLPEFLKADNREAALRISRVLSMAGLRLERREGKDWPESEQAIIRQTIEDNIDLLAEAEHDGWVEARLRHGWQLGEMKNVDLRESHLLVRYPDLPARIKIKQEYKEAGPEKIKEGPQQGKPMTVDQEVEHEKGKDRNSVRKYVDIIARTEYWIVEETVNQE